MFVRISESKVNKSVHLIRFTFTTNIWRRNRNCFCVSLLVKIIKYWLTWFHEHKHLTEFKHERLKLFPADRRSWRSRWRREAPRWCKRELQPHLNFTFHFDTTAATSVFSVICQYKMNRKGNFELNCFDSICLLNYQYNMTCSHYSGRTQQLALQLFLHFQWTTWNIAICMVSNLSWYKRIVKFLPILSPNADTNILYLRYQPITSANQYISWALFKSSKLTFWLKSSDITLMLHDTIFTIYWVSNKIFDWCQTKEAEDHSEADICRSFCLTQTSMRFNLRRCKTKKTDVEKHIKGANHNIWEARITECVVPQLH